VLKEAEINQATDGEQPMPGSFLRLLLCLVVLLGASLLFLLEPLSGKIITPRFGGTAGTWSVCLFFFQLAILAGYGLTWWLSRVGPRTQLCVFGALGLLSAIWSHIPPPPQWLNAGGDPAMEVLFLLVRHLAVPSIFLASLSGTMQVWYQRARLGDPYPLYSVSNIGSLLSLIAYPVMIEPVFSVEETTRCWAVADCMLAVLVPLAAGAVWRRRSQLPAAVDAATTAESLPEQEHSRWIWWTTCSIAGSLMLMSYTSYMTSDIAPVPLLWVAPLALYLLSFVLVFSGKNFYRPVFFIYLWFCVACFEPVLGERVPILRVCMSLLLVFMTCMVCHGELALSRPAPSKLPVFYFCMSLGGVIAGIFSALVAPSLFDFEVERWLAVGLVAYISVMAVVQRRLFLVGHSLVSYFWLGVCCAGLVVIGISQTLDGGCVQRARNFYSAVYVARRDGKTKLYHGQILHGEQFLREDLASKPTIYYLEAVKLIDDFLRSERKGAPLNIGAIGLGTGTLAAYGREGDRLTFFELDPKIPPIANQWFSYLKRSKATIEIKLGDGRASLDKMPPGNFDMIFIDAFNGDAIPLHLLTTEAMSIYSKHVRRDGLIVFHITNKYVNLPRPVAETARAAGLYPILLEKDEPRLRYLVLAKQPLLISRLYGFGIDRREELTQVKIVETPHIQGDRPWSDNFANIFSAFRY
jgi:predicted O-methyltransferase YrrM